MKIFKKKIYCPNCKHQLEVAPKRKAKCPHCKQYIYIREGKLVTGDDALKIDWLVYLDQFGITDQKFESSREELSKKFKTKASAHDTVWSILNSLVATRPEDAYREMARLVSQEGKDAQPYIEQALRTQLMSYKTRGIKTVWVVGYCEEPDYSTCSGCVELNRKQFSIDEALDKMPVPRYCTSGWCRCGYVTEDPAIKHDLI